MATLQTPYLKKTASSTQLIVDGKPFLMRAAELQNSSLSSAEYMMTKWQDLVDAHINTVLGSVTWETIEREEGKFDFSGLDKVIADARTFELRLALLWFGAFKNGASTYTPPWIKMDEERFPRVRTQDKGKTKTVETMSLFGDEVVQADSKAFAALMRHLKEVDGQNTTVIMVQVENEPGLLGDSRDRSDLANKAFAQNVPHDLLDFLRQDWESLHPDLQANICNLKQSNQSGSWEQVFGIGKHTDELFMAYHYTKFVDEVARAGKEEYSLPLYTNVWLRYGESDGEMKYPIIVGGGGDPGDYPSGGAVSRVFDIWMQFAPHLDFIAPDIYLNDYTSSCARYRHRGQPLFISEQRRDEYGARRIWTAYASYQALGVSPFGIDTVSAALNPFRKHYALLEQVSQIVLEAQNRPTDSAGFFFDELDTGNGVATHEFSMGKFQVSIQRAHVFGKPGPGAGMIIYRGGSERTARFLLIGWGFQAVFKSIDAQSHFTGILRFDEKKVVNKSTGELKTVRSLGGDETRGGAAAIMPNEDPDYGGFPISILIPAATMIAEVEVYSLLANHAKI